MKEDYLASEKFHDKEIECSIDAFFQGFDECIHQIKELDPNFNVARLKRGNEGEDEEEEEEEKEGEGETKKYAFVCCFYFDIIEAHIVISSSLMKPCFFHITLNLVCKI